MSRLDALVSGEDGSKFSKSQGPNNKGEGFSRLRPDGARNDRCPVGQMGRGALVESKGHDDAAQIRQFLQTSKDWGDLIEVEISQGFEEKERGRLLERE